MLPSVDEILRSEGVQSLVREHGQRVVTEATRAVLGRVRAEVSAGSVDAEHLQRFLHNIADAVRQQVQRSLQPSLRAVINATGVILHTNLGRAPLIPSAFERIREIAIGYSNLEFDLETGERGHRDSHVDEWFAKLIRPSVSTEVSTIVVNNNAAAVLLALNTLAEGGEVIVSRGELVEIGGSFRIPDVMGKSQATLREVGTTNRTRIEDYERAINDRTRLLLRVHRSNFEIVGFTEQPTLRELAALAAKHRLPLMEDLGSGSLTGLRSVGIPSEQSVLESLEAGVDVVTYSGDKLLGGPQCGMLTGRKDVIARMRKNSLFRALRVDKMTYAALEATLLAYVKGEAEAIPALRMMNIARSEIAGRAETLARRVSNPELRINLLDGESVIGGGAAPSATLPTRLLALQHAKFSAGELASRLRDADPPIIARVENGEVVLDLRTVFPEQDNVVATTLQRL
jgi:L-seryl-tRNA(Ser) seleniumtransferase